MSRLLGFEKKTHSEEWSFKITFNFEWNNRNCCFSIKTVRKSLHFCQDLGRTDSVCLPCWQRGVTVFTRANTTHQLQHFCGWSWRWGQTEQKRTADRGWSGLLVSPRAQQAGQDSNRSQTDREGGRREGEQNYSIYFTEITDRSVFKHSTPLSWAYKFFFYFQSIWSLSEDR